MFRMFALSVAVSIAVMSLTPAAAQISFGVTQQNGRIGGGSLTVGGFVTNGGTGVRLGISTSTSQLISVPTFTFRNGGNFAQGNIQNNGQLQQPQAPNPQAMANQFTQAAGRFDADKSGTLDKSELEKVASAVIAELKQRNKLPKQAAAINAAAKPQNGAAAAQPAKPPTTEEMVESFVKRSLTFDKNKDEALNAAETKAMATAFLKTLS